MTQGEFAKGWRLLILQPWGWRYRGLTPDGKPTPEAQLQLTLYFSKLKWADPRAWWKVAELYAQGNEWPCINDLRFSLQSVNTQFVKAIPCKQTGEPMPAEVRDMIANIGIQRDVLQDSRP